MEAFLAGVMFGAGAFVGVILVSLAFMVAMAIIDIRREAKDEKV